MASRKRKGDPWLGLHEEEVVLSCLTEMEERRRRAEIQLRPHPELGPLFSRLSETNVRSLRGTRGVYYTKDLLTEYPGRFTGQFRRQSRYHAYGGQTVPSPALNAVMTRLVKKGLLRDVRWGSGPRRFVLANQINDQRRTA